MKVRFITAMLLGFFLVGGVASADSPRDRHPNAFNKLDVNHNGHVGRGDLLKLKRDNNPPGRLGGRGTNWENPPGPRGGPGASPDRKWRRDRDNNPPGRLGGRGTNWENPPGPKGGPGASPDRQNCRR